MQRIKEPKLYPLSGIFCFEYEQVSNSDQQIYW